MTQEAFPTQPPLEHVSTPPLVQETQDAIWEASPDVVGAALQNEVTRIQDGIWNATNSGNETQKAHRENELRDFATVRGVFDKWKRDLKSGKDVWDDFPTHINAEAEEALELGDTEHPSLRAKEWLDSGDYEKLVGAVLRSREANVEQSQPQRATAEVETKPLVAPEQAAEQKQQATTEARKSVERARSAEVFDEVLDFAKNKTQLNTDVHGGFKSFGDGPAAERYKEVIPADLRQKVENESKDWRMHLNEAVAFTQVVDPEYREEQSERVIKPGNMFKAAVTQTETYQVAVPGSEKPRMMLNEKTGKEEPVVRFRYQFKYSVPASNSQELPHYAEFRGNRGGQQVLAGIDLPQSVAIRLQEQVTNDPASVRGLVEQLFLEHNDGTMGETEWREGGEIKHPVRPPYEALPKDWNIAIVTGKEKTGTDLNKSGHIQDPTIQRQRTSA
jgi:hypothetical protein